MRKLLNSSVFLYTIIGLLSLAGTAIVLHRTAEYGVGLNTSDAVNYLSAARSLADGDDLLLARGEIMHRWTPLFPALLAIPTIVDIDPLTTGRYMNALSFGMMILLTGAWLMDTVEHKPLVILGTLAVLLAEPLVRLSSLLRSEPVYIVLTLLFCISMVRFLSTQQRRSLILVILWTGLATMQRPVGASLIGTGGLLILFAMPRVTLSRRVLYAGVYGVFSSLPFGWWFIRNYHLTGTIMGHREDSLDSLTDNFRIVYNIVEHWITSAWWIPERVSRALPGEAIVLVFSVLFVAGLALLLKHLMQNDAEKRLKFVTLSAVVVIYMAFLIYTATTIFVGLHFEMDRFVIPVFLPLVWLGFWALDYVATRLMPHLTGRKMLLAVAMLGLGLAWGSLATFRNIRQLADQTPSSMYTEPEWQASELMAWVRDELPTGFIYSNDELAVYLLTERHTGRAPRVRDYDSVTDLADFEGLQHAQDTNVYFVLFNDTYVDLGLSEYHHFPQGYFTPDELAGVMDLELLVELDDGACYQLHPSAPTGATQN